MARRTAQYKNGHAMSEELKLQAEIDIVNIMIGKSTVDLLGDGHQ